MIDEEKNENEEAPETPAEEAPAEEAPAEEAPAAEAPAEEAAAEDAPPEDAPAAEEPAAEEAPAEEAPASPDEAEPAEALSPREARRRSRSQHTVARPKRSLEERRQDREAARAKKAASRRRWRAKQAEKRRAAGPSEQAQTPPVERDAGKPRVRQGVVVSNKADKTITVRIESKRAHRTYGKVMRSTSTLHVHDEENDASAGDTVRVIESRPLSRLKRWRLVEVMERAR